MLLLMPLMLMLMLLMLHAGKTTLLDVISGRKNSGTITGEVLYGVSPASQSFLRRSTGYGGLCLGSGAREVHLQLGLGGPVWVG